MDSMTYSQALKELETIVAELQGDNCDIDSLTAKTTCALTLLKFCKEKLLKTDEEVKKCLEELNSLNN